VGSIRLGGSEKNEFLEPTLSYSHKKKSNSQMLTELVRTALPCQKTCPSGEDMLFLLS
jgi:hypothetical protein